MHRASKSSGEGKEEEEVEVGGRGGCSQQTEEECWVLRCGAYGWIPRVHTILWPA